MPREGHMKSVPGVLLCPSTYHQPGQEKGKEMQSWLGHFEEGQTILWDALSPQPASCFLLWPTVYIEGYFSSRYRAPLLLIPVLKMGEYFFMVCFCYFLSKMPWDHRPLGTSSWVQAWLMVWSSKFSDVWMERWRGKLEKRKEKRNTLVWLAVCLKRGSCVLSKVRYHLKTGLLCKQLASSRREEISWLNKCSPPPTQWKDARTWALTGFLAPQGLCPCYALCLEALLCLSQGRCLIFQALRSEWHFLALLADLSSLPSPLSSSSFLLSFLSVSKILKFQMATIWIQGGGGQGPHLACLLLGVHVWRQCLARSWGSKIVGEWMGFKFSCRHRWVRLRGANFQLQNKCHQYEMYSVGNTVNNFKILLYGDVL